jgi:hypothetical protein
MLTAPCAAGWLEHLATLAHQAMQANTQPYLLIDGAFLPGLRRKLAALSPTLLFESLPGCNDNTRDVSPLLLAYTPAAVRWLERTSGWPMLSVIATRESQRQLADRLAAWCIVEADGQRFNFRFPDTRRLPAIFAALTSGQQAQMTGPAASWSYIARDGNWRQLALPGIDSAIAERPTVLTGAQFASLVADSEADEVLSLLSGRGHEHAHDPYRAYCIVTQALATIPDAHSDVFGKVDWCARHLNDDGSFDTARSQENGGAQ